MRRGGAFTRAGLARACAALGLLIGLVLMQESAHVDDPHTAGCHSLYSVAMLVADDCTPPAAPAVPDHPAELLGVCLALLVAVLLAVAVLAAPRARKVLLTQLRAPRPPTHRFRPAPRLALLCVLRT